MAFYYSKRKLKPREEEHVGELNIVPYLDILMNLIIFMLLSMTGLAAFGILNVNAPNYGPPGAGAAAPAEGEKLLLTVAISHKGFFIAGAGAVLGAESAGTGNQVNAQGEPTIPRKVDGNYDYPALTGKILQIKKAFPNETKVVIAADGDTAYETLIATMDALRETTGAEHQILFPDVTLAAMGG
jgi:biopolymer transport protein TolR